MSWSTTTFSPWLALPHPRIAKDTLLDPEWTKLHPEEAEPTHAIFDLFKADKRTVDHAYQMRHSNYISNLHAHMDYALSAHLSSFQLQLQEGRADDFWQHFWYIVEHSINDFSGAASRDDGQEFMGRWTKLGKKTTFSPTYGRGDAGTAAPGLNVKYII